MVSDEELRRLKNLASQYRIKQRFQSDEWPTSHKPAFECVQRLGQTSFQHYSANIDRESHSEPWRRQNKARAEWLVEQASRLSQNTANESTWRMRIENAVLERFSFEVACPKCKYRLWRSEIESKVAEAGRTWAELDARRIKRGPCMCAVQDRPQDPYEIGTSRLFEERVEETVVHRDPSGELPKQRPDRTIGLRETNNIRVLLDQPPTFQPDSIAPKIRDLVRCSPFKWQSNPLLFPFLVIEAKSDSAQDSFSDMQTQTSFPIWSLLNLQKDLQSLRPNDVGRPQPLVWFLGYRGSDWKVYGCYLGLDSGSNLTYSIHYLQGGDITTEDGALKLLLLIDYVMDWARDTFRPSIIGQLTALATGRGFDEVSLGPDSDIFSKNRTVWDWMSRRGNTLIQDDAADTSYDPQIRPEDHDDLSSVYLPNTEFGTVRPVSAAMFHLAGLRITEGNVKSVMALCDGPHNFDPLTGRPMFSQSARKLINEITRWDEIFLILGADLDYIEHVWTNEGTSAPDPFDEGPGAEVFVVIQYRCFLNTRWELIRELSYLAITKSAFDILVKAAAFHKRHPGIEAFPKALRPCSSELMKGAIDCLHSGSAWQVLHSALSSTLVSLCPEPERKREDFPPSVEFVGLGYPSTYHVRIFVEDFIKMTEKRPPKLKKNMFGIEHAQKRLKTELDLWEQRPSNRSFEKRFQQAIPLDHAAHDPSICTRCKSSGQDFFGLKYWDPQNLPSPTAYDAILIASLNEEGDRAFTHQERHDLSLFVLGSSPALSNEMSISTVVEDLAQNDSIYHTIRHELLKQVGGSSAVLWNLPFPYRKSMERQRQDIARWAGELRGQSVPVPETSKDSTPLFVHEQILYHFLRKGMTYDEALLAAIGFCDQWRSEVDERRKQPASGHPFLQVTNRIVTLDQFFGKMSPDRSGISSQDGNRWLPEKLRLRGESPGQ